MTTRLLAASLVIVAASLTFTGCGSNRELDHKSVEAQEAQKRIDELERLLADCESGKTSQSIKESKAAGDGDTVDADQKAVGSKARVSTRDKEIVISIENSVLFAPGKAELSSQAKATLAKVATLLKEKYAGHHFRVEGHTDDQKITRTKNEWDDNWDLAGGRARVVLHYLLDRGLPAKEAGFAGYADQRPLVPNSNDGNRAKNRRVEIVVLDK